MRYSKRGRTQKNNHNTANGKLFAVFFGDGKMMEFYYQGKNISEYVDIAECIHREHSNNKCDCLEITLEHADDWYQWKPQIDDSISVSMDGYRTGKLYLNTIFPENDRFRIFATGLPRAGRTTGNESYTDTTLNDLIERCAGQSGMTGKLYGLDGTRHYVYLERSGESTAAFMSRILTLESACFKTVNGRFAGIGIESVQDGDPVQRITVLAGTSGVTHVKRADKLFSSLTIKTPYASATAYDDGAPSGNAVLRTDIPAANAAEATRWARGLLLNNNRSAETVRIETEFNPNLNAMVRVDLVSDSEMNGAWIVDETEHDLIRKRTTATLVRSIQTIR
jgi:phage protein D